MACGARAGNLYDLGPSKDRPKAKLKIAHAHQCRLLAPCCAYVQGLQVDCIAAGRRRARDAGPRGRGARAGDQHRALRRGGPIPASSASRRRGDIGASGTFSDEDGHYPAGWYLRNPPGSGHRPFSDEGAVIFVKLWQMPGHETRCVRIDTNDPASWRRDGEREICQLFSADAEQVCLQRLTGGQAVLPDPVDGAELLVLAGALRAGGQSYERGSWVRLPAGAYPEFVAAAEGASFYLKTGHLRDVTGVA